MEGGCLNIVAHDVDLNLAVESSVLEANMAHRGGGSQQGNNLCATSVLRTLSSPFASQAAHPF